MAQTENIRNILEKAKNIVIFWHIYPDGDCIGAMLWLGKLLEKQQKTVKYVVPTPVSSLYDAIPWIHNIQTTFDYKEYDVLLFVDFSQYERLWPISQWHESYFKKQHLIIIDHHIGNVSYPNADVIKDTTSISTCEILFEYTFKWRKAYYDKDIATAFYLWITTDSGNFLFEKDHIRTHRNALQLLEYGANKDIIVSTVLRRISFSKVQFLQLLLKRLTRKNEVMYTYYL